ncbi:myosin heavy chain isoform X1 [Octopus bimaculoides]|nr:myosin heavy chain isoform X1 [Octopus bimaculoides]
MTTATTATTTTTTTTTTSFNTQTIESPSDLTQFFNPEQNQKNESEKQTLNSSTLVSVTRKVNNSEMSCPGPSHKLLALYMDERFKEIRNNKPTYYLEHLKRTPLYGLDSRVYEKMKFIHKPVNKYRLHADDLAPVNEIGRIEECSDTESIRTEDFESRFLELLVSPNFEDKDFDSTKKTEKVTNKIDVGNEELAQNFSAESSLKLENENEELCYMKFKKDLEERHLQKNMEVCFYQSLDLARATEIKQENSLNHLAVIGTELPSPNLKAEQISAITDSKENISSLVDVKSSPLQSLNSSIASFQPLPDCTSKQLLEIVGVSSLLRDIDATNFIDADKDIQQKKLEQITDENIKLRAEAALLLDKMREKEHASRFHTIPEETEEELSQLRLKCKHMAFTLEKRDEKVKELSDIIDQQKETISCNKQKVLAMESQFKTFSQQLEELKSKLKQEERKATDLREENEKLRKQLSLEEEGRENTSRLQGNGMETLQNQLFLQKEEMEQLMECHLKSLEELNSAHRMESECLIQKYERRIADIICSQNSQNAAKEYQISMLESQLNNLKYENQLLQQKWKLKATGKELFKPQKNLANSLEDEHTKSEDFIRQYEKCEVGKAEDSRLNPETSYRVDLENLKKDIKENLSKDLHKRLVTLLECIHQQELELQDLKNIWKQMNQNNKHLNEWLDNSGSANSSRECGSCGGGCGCGCVCWQSVIVNLLKEESQLNFSILNNGKCYEIDRSTKKCNGTKDAVWYKDSMTGKATMLDVLSEPMKIAFGQLSASTQQLRQLLKLFIERYITLQTEFPKIFEMVGNNKNVDPFNDSSRDHRCDSVHTSLVSRTLLDQPATSTTNWLDETYRMFLIETDLNHQAKALLELLQSYSNLQETRIPTPSTTPPPTTPPPPPPPPLPCCCYSTL